MKIFKENLFENLQNLVEAKAKYQKVLLIYDDTITQIQLNKIYDVLKSKCVFNKMPIDRLDKMEIANGYKMLLFFCCGKNFFNLNLNSSEFVNVFVPTDANILPFFVDENNCQNSQNNFLFLQHNLIDENIIFSCLFNKVYAAFKAILSNENLPCKQLNFSFLTQRNTLEILSDFENETFEDFRILKQMNLPYEVLPKIDYLLLLAMDLLTTAIKEKTYTLTDIYKNLKDDYAKINKFYSLNENQLFVQLVNLNFFYLNNLLKQSIGTINEIFNLKTLFNNCNLNLLLSHIKEFSKNDDVVLNYLFLYNVFG